MNSDHIDQRLTRIEEMLEKMAAFFVAPVTVAPDQDAKDRLELAVRMPFIRAEVERQRIASAERKARKLQKRAA